MYPSDDTPVMASVPCACTFELVFGPLSDPLQGQCEVDTHFKVFVGHLLPFFAHRLGRWSSEVSDGEENGSRCGETVCNKAEDFPLLRGVG